MSPSRSPRGACSFMQAVVCALFVSCATPSLAVEPSLRSPRLQALSRAAAAGEDQASSTFWLEVARRGTPLIEPLADGVMLLTFVVRANGMPDERAPGIYGQLGDTGGPMPARAALQRLEGTDVWYRTYEMSDRARFSYHVIRPRRDVADPQAVGDITVEGEAHELFVDPLNPRTWVNGWMRLLETGEWTEDWPVRGSYAEGPHALVDRYATPRQGVKRGKASTHDVGSELLGNQRKITVYTPPGHERGCAECDFLLVFDRAAYISAVPTPTILDNMQADRVIRPLVAVFVGNSRQPGRGEELPPNPLFQRFLREELLPWVRERYRFSSDPRRSVVAGSSFGGLAATYTALKNPDVFGNVLSQSGSYWWWPQWLAAGIRVTEQSGTLIREYRDAARLPIRFYMETGTWEGEVMLEPNREFRDVLLRKGYDVQYEERIGGHDYVRWRDSLSEGLRRLLGQ
ncbi:MAG TPA: alpha/beta hydrolase-fold protein [Steroidobacteraceae bacterium]|nr:alpha/beta hydrolase-fold protein [Steroidobacteraceae bacterium]